MMKKGIVACDVDLTVVDTGYAWYKWLEDMTKAGFSYEWVSQWYDFSIPYSVAWKNKGCSGSPFDFWRAKSVYDNLKPIEGCVDALEMLNKKGYKIVFVSAIKGDHHKSKHSFLKQYFPFMDGFVATKEKWAVNADIIIDDRHKFINMFTNPDTMRIIKDTKHEQDENLKVSVDHVIYDWCDFEIWAQDYL